MLVPSIPTVKMNLYSIIQVIDHEGFNVFLRVKWIFSLCNHFSLHRLYTSMNWKTILFTMEQLYGKTTFWIFLWYVCNTFERMSNEMNLHVLFVSLWSASRETSTSVNRALSTRPTLICGRTSWHCSSLLFSSWF